MIIYISGELFWRLLSECQKKQVKLSKMDDFVQKNWVSMQKYWQITIKNKFF